MGGSEREILLQIKIVRRSRPVQTPCIGTMAAVKSGRRDNPRMNRFEFSKLHLEGLNIMCFKINVERLIAQKFVAVDTLFPFLG